MFGVSKTFFKEINTFIPQGSIKLNKSDSKNSYHVTKANQHIRMISERSCDTEDWSNDAENSALHHRNKLLF